MVFAIRFNEELLLDVAEDTACYVIISLNDFKAFVMFSSEEQIYLFIFNLTVILLLVSSRVILNQQFCW